MSEAKQFNISKRAVIAAFELVKENAGTCGVDGQSIEAFEKDLYNNLYKLWNRMASGSYFPKPVRAVAIPKKNGGTRILGIPTVEDRVAQMVAKLYFEPMVEPLFYNDSYGYRPNKSAIDALRQARERCFRRDWVLELDIKGLFDNIKHGYLMYMVEKHTDCKWLILYIKRWLTVPFVMEDGSVVERRSGTPQGGVISPVLANLFLHYAFDDYMAKAYPNIWWERYADDGAETGHRPEEDIADKSREGKFFVGFTPAVSEKAKTVMKQKIRSWKIQMKANYTLQDIGTMINKVVQGWINYYTHFYKSEFYEVLRYLNKCLIKWVRRSFKKKNTRRRAEHWLGMVARRDRNLFAHWKFGILPAVGEGAV